MNHFFKYCLLFLTLIFVSVGGEAQKKLTKKNKATVSKTAVAKKKRNSKKNTKKKKGHLNNIDRVIFKDEVPQATSQAKTLKLDTVPEKVVNILSAFKPQLKNVAKISFTSATAQSDTTTLQMNYQVPSQNLSFQFQPVALVPRTYKLLPTEIYNNLASLKFGYGNYARYLIDFNTTLTDNASNIHSISLFNEQSQGALHLQTTKDFGIKYISDIQVGEQSHLHTQIFYQNSQRYRYGLVDDATNLPNSNFEQSFSHMGGAFKWVNSNDKSLFSLISPIVKIEHFTGTENAKNTWFEIYNPLFIKFENNVKFNFNFSYNFNEYQLATGNKVDNGILNMEPSLEFIRWATNFKLGASSNITNGVYTFNPALDFRKKLADTTITLLGGWHTILTNNQYTMLAMINPWIAAPTDMKITTQEKKNFGVEINASKNLKYGIGLSLNDYRNLPLFNRILNNDKILAFNTTQSGLKYKSIFEYRAITIELEGNLRYQFSDKLLFQNNFKYIQFNSIKENDKPWGILPLELNSALSWTPNKKWTLDGGFNYWTGAALSNSKNLPVDLSNSLVLNAGLTYQWTPSWKAWFKADNLLDKPYQRWADYPSLGLQLITGVVYSFHK